MSDEPARISVMEAHRLAGVVCARLCHDMSGPLGALSACLEELGETRRAEPDGEAFSLAGACVRVMTARLRLLRTAWGLEGDAPDEAGLQAMMPGLPGADRLGLDASGLRTEPGGAGRLPAALLLAAASCMPRGGSIRLSGGGTQLSVEIQGPQASWPDGLAEHGPEEMARLAAHAAPRDLPVHMAFLLAWSEGMQPRRLSDTVLLIRGEPAPG